MKETLEKRCSPFEQVMRSRRVAIPSAAIQLSAEDQSTLKQILSGRCEYVPNPIFDRTDAETKVFAESPKVARPDTSWYHPLMESGSDTSRSKNVGTVLLTAAEERALFLQFNYCRYRVKKLRDRIGEGPINPDQARQLLYWHRRAEEYRDQIAQTNLALVLAMAKRARLSEMDFSDLVSEGNMALLRAVDKFDVSRGFKFSTYACRAILKAFSRSGVSMSKYRQLFPTDFDPKLERSDYQDRKRAEHEEDCVDEVRDILRDNRADLTDIERSVIEHRFALGSKLATHPHAQPMTLEQVGRIVGVTKERVRQIQNKALSKIRQTLEVEFLG